MTAKEEARWIALAISNAGLELGPAGVVVDHAIELCSNDKHEVRELVAGYLGFDFYDEIYWKTPRFSE